MIGSRFGRYGGATCAEALDHIPEYPLNRSPHPSPRGMALFTISGEGNAGAQRPITAEQRALLFQGLKSRREGRITGRKRSFTDPFTDGNVRRFRPFDGP
jgi:hypothetical protein